MFKRFKTLDMFNKSVVVIAIYSVVALIVGLVLLCINPFWLYGTLLGLLLVIVTTMISYWIYKIPVKGAMNAVGLPTISLVMRVIVFITMFCITIFVINPLLVDGNGTFDQIYLFRDINVFVMLFVYMIPMYSYFTVGFIELFSKE